MAFDFGFGIVPPGPLTVVSFALRYGTTTSPFQQAGLPLVAERLEKVRAGEAEPTGPLAGLGELVNIPGITRALDVAKDIRPTQTAQPVPSPAPRPIPPKPPGEIIPFPQPEPTPPPREPKPIPDRPGEPKPKPKPQEPIKPTEPRERKPPKRETRPEKVKEILERAKTKPPGGGERPKIPRRGRIGVFLKVIDVLSGIFERRDIDRERQEEEAAKQAQRRKIETQEEAAPVGSAESKAAEVQQRDEIIVTTQRTSPAQIGFPPAIPPEFLVGAAIAGGALLGSSALAGAAFAGKPASPPRFVPESPPEGPRITDPITEQPPPPQEQPPVIGETPIVTPPPPVPVPVPPPVGAPGQPPGLPPGGGGRPPPRRPPQQRKKKEKCKEVKRKRQRNKCVEGFYEERKGRTIYTPWRLVSCRTGKTLKDLRAAKRFGRARRILSGR